MTINEAIAHCEARAKADCSECAKEHRQLAEWLQKLKKHRWIPVEERLPREPEDGKVDFDDLEDYIVMIDGAQRPTFLAYAGDGEWYRDGTFYRVRAWMPLPEPYEP